MFDRFAVSRLSVSVSKRLHDGASKYTSWPDESHPYAPPAWAWQEIDFMHLKPRA